MIAHGKRVRSKSTAVGHLSGTEILWLPSDTSLGTFPSKKTCTTLRCVRELQMARDSTRRCGQGTGGGVRRFVQLHLPSTLTIALTVILTMLCPLGDATRRHDAGPTHSRKRQDYAFHIERRQIRMASLPQHWESRQGEMTVYYKQWIDSNWTFAKGPTQTPRVHYEACISHSPPGSSSAFRSTSAGWH